jgi:predicted HAD superfamily Cof-like phosphohydrolase
MVDFEWSSGDTYEPKAVLVAGRIFRRTAFDQVHELMMAAHRDRIPAKPQLPSRQTFDLICKMIQEEFDELKQAYEDNNLLEFADAICDLEYVTLNAASFSGLQALYDVMFAEVHRANMTKVWPDGTFHYNEYGKAIKPPGFEAPSLRPILEGDNA